MTSNEAPDLQLKIITLVVTIFFIFVNLKKKLLYGIFFYKIKCYISFIPLREVDVITSNEKYTQV